MKDGRRIRMKTLHTYLNFAGNAEELIHDSRYSICFF